MALALIEQIIGIINTKKRNEENLDEMELPPRLHRRIPKVPTRVAQDAVEGR
jgi:hypothetical protein